MRRKLSIAVTDFVDWPATYRRIFHDASIGDLGFFGNVDFGDRKS
jgi:hypothetical protein